VSFQCFRTTGATGGGALRCLVFPFRRNPFRRIMEKCIVWQYAVVLWKKSFSVSPYLITFLVRTLSYYNSELHNIPSMQNWVLLILMLNARKLANRAVFPAFKIKMSKTQFCILGILESLEIIIAQSSD